YVPEDHLPLNSDKLCFFIEEHNRSLYYGFVSVFPPLGNTLVLFRYEYDRHDMRDEWTMRKPYLIHNNLMAAGLIMHFGSDVLSSNGDHSYLIIVLPPQTQGYYFTQPFGYDKFAQDEFEYIIKHGSVLRLLHRDNIAKNVRIFICYLEGTLTNFPQFLSNDQTVYKDRPEEFMNTYYPYPTKKDFKTSNLIKVAYKLVKNRINANIEQYKTYENPKIWNKIRNYYGVFEGRIDVRMLKRMIKQGKVNRSLIWYKLFEEQLIGTWRLVSTVENFENVFATMEIHSSITKDTPLTIKKVIKTKLNVKPL